MDRRFLTALFCAVCFLMLSPDFLGQTGTVIVKTSVDDCSRTKLVISLFRTTPSPDKALFVLKDSTEKNAKILFSQELIQQTDGKYYWTGIIPFRNYLAELYSFDKKTLLGRYSFNTEDATRKFITDKLYEIIQLRQGEEARSDQQDDQAIQITNVKIVPEATSMQILIITEKGGVVAQYLGTPVSNWSSPEKVPAGAYRKVILQFGANGCRLV